MFKIKRIALVALLLMACSSSQSEQDLLNKARAIHNKVLTIDTHCDTPMRMVNSDWDVSKRHEPGQRGSGKIDLPRMKEGGLDAEFFAAYVAQKDRTAENYRWAKSHAEEVIAAIKKMCAQYPQTIALSTTADDAYENEKNGILSAFIGIENGFAIGKDLSNLKHFYDMGVRYITLCHVGNNDICDSSTDKNGPEHNGVSDFGRQVVAEMNRLGMIIDVSHISDQAFFDVLELSKAPVIASHSCARALRDHPRNLSDEMLKALAAKGGVMQMCFMSDYIIKAKPNPEREQALAALRQKYGSWGDIKDPQVREQSRDEYHAVLDKYPGDRATVQDLVDHIDHVVQLVGVDYVGIGTDFDGGGGVVGCDDVLQMPNITIELVKRGYAEDDIRKIWGGNFMRVFRQVEKAAGLNMAKK